jgi:endoglucanase
MLLVATDVNKTQRAFLESLLSTASPSGYETNGQRVWIDYVSEFADQVTTDDYGNAVAVHEGSGEGPEIAFTGHADEIGFIVRDIDDNGFLRISRIGGSDRTISQGQHVTIHSDDDPVQGVIGQTAIHLRDVGTEEYNDIAAQFVDIGAEDADEAEELVEVGDPITFSRPSCSNSMERDSLPAGWTTVSEPGAQPKGCATRSKGTSTPQCTR